MPSESGPRYRVIDLGTLPGGDYSVAYAINNNGQVAGLSSLDTRTKRGIRHSSRAVLWDSKGTPQLIGKQEPDLAAFAINDRGQVLIRSENIDVPHAPESAPRDYHVIQWDNGNTKVWHRAEFHSNVFLPQAQNNKGILVGHVADGPWGTWHAAIEEAGKVRVLRMPFARGMSSACAINDQGLIGGFFMLGNQTHGFLSVSNAAIDPVPKAVDEGFSAVNSKGEASVTARDGKGVTRLLMWWNGKLRTLGALNHGGKVNGINNRSEIIGEASGAPFLYSAGRFYTCRQMLVNPGLKVLAFTGINDRGQIVGYAAINGTRHAVRLDPVRQ